MITSAIVIKNLTKAFYTREGSSGVLSALKGLFYTRKKEITAIKDLSFEIKVGERVAFIGPNGAGKSTTIKMMTGILHPTSGEVKVLGLVPWLSRHALGYQIGTVFGQRSQLWVHLPPIDTFSLLSKIYELDPIVYQKHLDELVELFEISHLLHRPVKQLSLGERMRCEIVASLLHKPKILFLDEPTIGLDINAKLMIRSLFNRLSKEQGITLFLTSHDTADIEQVCDRVIVLDKGSIVTDSSLKELKKSYMKRKVLTLNIESESLPLNLPHMKILENAHYNFSCEVDVEVISIDRVIQEALKLTTIKDIAIGEPSMEEIIRDVQCSNT